MPVVKPKEPPKPERPGFSRTYAKARGLPTGVEEAIVMRFLAFKVEDATRKRRQRNFKEEKYWYYQTLKKLSDRTGIPKSTLGEALGRLEADGQVVRGNFNKLRKLDRTVWYWVPEEVRDAVEDDIIYFDRVVARKLKSICAGVLYANLSYISRKDRHFWCNMSPARLERLLPFSKATIKRELAKLTKAKFIIKDVFENAMYRIPVPPEFRVVDGNIIEIAKAAPQEENDEADGDDWLSEAD